MGIGEIMPLTPLWPQTRGVAHLQIPIPLSHQIWGWDLIFHAFLLGVIGVGGISFSMHFYTVLSKMGPKVGVRAPQK